MISMRSFKLVLFAGVIALSPSPAHAQVFGAAYRPPAGVGGGILPPYSYYNNSPGIGLLGNGYYLGPSLRTPYYGGVLPYAGMSAPGPFVPGSTGGGVGSYGGGMAGEGGGETNVLILPGFSAAEKPRSRPQMYPAISLNAADMAKLKGDENAITPVAGTAEGKADPSAARIQLTLPCTDADVTIDGVKMMQTGSVRNYVTPPLQSGAHYSSTLRASFQGRVVERQLSFHAGQAVQVKID